MRIFTPEQALLDIGSDYLRIAVFTLPLMAVSTLISRILQGMGHGIPGLIINLVRVIILGVPLSYFFVFVWGYGYLSIAVAMVIGGIGANIVGVAMLRSRFKEMSKVIS